MATGVPLRDCRRVAELLGIRTFVAGFVSYMGLLTSIKNRHLLETHLANNGSYVWEGDDVILLNSTSVHVLSGGYMTVSLEHSYLHY